MLRKYCGRKKNDFGREFFFLYQFMSADEDRIFSNIQGYSILLILN